MRGSTDFGLTTTLHRDDKRLHVQQRQSRNSLEFTTVECRDGMGVGQCGGGDLQVPFADGAALGFKFRSDAGMIPRLRQTEGQHREVSQDAFHEANAPRSHRGLRRAETAMQEFRCGDGGEHLRLRIRQKPTVYNVDSRAWEALPQGHIAGVTKGFKRQKTPVNRA